MKTNLMDLRARVVIMKEYLEIEECTCGVDTQYGKDLRQSIKQCNMRIKDLEFSQRNPMVRVS